MVSMKAEEGAVRPGVDRVDEILAATGKVIARVGMRRLRIQDVAREAGVSKALVHYYFPTREGLLARAYEFADDRAREHVRVEVAGLQSAYERLVRLLLSYFEDESEMSEDWILWFELSASAVFEPALRPTMESSFARWIAWIEALVVEAVEDASVPADADPRATALRLSALIDGFGGLLTRGLVRREEARELMRAAIATELLRGNEPPPDREPSAATGYLRLLARLTKDAVAELEALAPDAATVEAIHAVSGLIENVGGGAASRLSAFDRDGRRRSREQGVA
jgi:AcrR family transcriptional regulator